MANPYSVAELSLPQSNQMNGLAAMNRTSATPGPNQFDSGGHTKPGAEGVQAFMNDRLASQNLMVRQSDLISQKQAQAVQDHRKERLVLDNQEYKDVAFREERKNEVLEVLGAPAIQHMGRMNDLERKAHRTNIATSNAMAAGLPADLVQNQLT